MGILGIPNRTENWKTAQTFAPFIGNQFALRLLAERLSGETPGQEEEVELELFWTGGRDYWYAAKENNAVVKPSPESLGRAYNHYFRNSRDLREEIEEFRKGEPSTKTFQSLLCRNYNVAGENAKKLTNHFRNTEFDVVLETSKYLFIGEAKDESNFDAKSKYVLVHQLIRQYVIAQILVHLAKRPKTIVPFVVAPGNKLKDLKKNSQIRFMMKEGYLKDSNILSWGTLTPLPSASPPPTE